MRATATAAFVFVGSEIAGAVRSAWFTNDMGAPPEGWEPWQLMHFPVSSAATSHGRSLATALEPVVPPLPELVAPPGFVLPMEPPVPVDSGTMLPTHPARNPTAETKTERVDGAVTRSFVMFVSPPIAWLRWEEVPSGPPKQAPERRVTY